MPTKRGGIKVVRWSGGVRIDQRSTRHRARAADAGPQHALARTAAKAADDERLSRERTWERGGKREARINASVGHGWRRQETRHCGR